MNQPLERPNVTTVIVPYVSDHAFAKNFLSFTRYLLIGCPAKGLTRCRSKKLNLAGSLYGRGIAKLKKGDATGGNADIAAAKAIRPEIADEFARYGVQ